MEWMGVWEYGIGGRKKAAKKTNPTERGMMYVKQNFSKRKVFWVIVNNICKCDHTAKAAISLISEVYGELQTMSYILTKIRIDKWKNQQFHVTVN